jgi:hypothetical protein
MFAKPPITWLRPKGNTFFSKAYYNIIGIGVLVCTSLDWPLRGLMGGTTLSFTVRVRCATTTLVPVWVQTLDSGLALLTRHPARFWHARCAQITVVWSRGI